MGEFQNLKSLFMAKVGSTTTRYWVYPRGAGGTAAAPTALGTVGIQCISDGAVATQVWAPYIQIEAAARIPSPCWLVGYYTHNALLDAPFNGDLSIAIGAAAAEVDILVVPLNGWVASAVGEGVTPWNWLPFPIRIDGSPRVAARVRKFTAANAAGVTLKIIVCTGLGTG